MPADDLNGYATSDVDFYALLNINAGFSQKELDRAWRRAALAYHPDKVGDDSVAKEKFQLAQIAYDLLSDPASKALYDNARNAKIQRERQKELFKGRRRELREDLERRESGVKRPREEDDEEKLEREIRRLAEDGKRRRKDREDALRRDIERESAGMHSGVQPSESDVPHTTTDATALSGMSELDRTVKVRWPVEGEGGSLSADRVRSLFSKFGKIESADVLNPKLLRLGSKQKKQLAIVCMLQYKSVVGAHDAVEDFPKQEGSDWKIFDSVFWAANKPPDFLNAHKSTETATHSAPSTPFSRSTKQQADSATTIKFSTPVAPQQVNGDGLKKKPSFASFSPGASTPKASPFGKGLGVNSPSLEEMTMIRLKNAEKRRLAAEIEKQDADDDAAAASK